ncbi:MAG: hypothetical protein LBD37_06025 [Treponema sp.]|jgi:hypothetical protein|nr:hypothetical protein [Treponema sp.]
MGRDSAPPVRTPPCLADRKQRKKELAELLDEYPLDLLKGLYSLARGEKPKALSRYDLIQHTAAALAFADDQAFLNWLETLPPATQRLLYQFTFEHFIPVPRVEQECNIPSPVQRQKGRFWEAEWVLAKESGLAFLHVYTECGHPILGMPSALRLALLPWFEPPASANLAACAVDGAPQSGDGDTAFWDNSNGAPLSLPLLYDALEELGRQKTKAALRYLRGFNKKELEFLRAASAFKPFAVPRREAASGAKDELKDADLVPDSADMLARFLLLMHNTALDERPENGQERIKALTALFFNEKSPAKNAAGLDRHSLEYNLLSDQFTKPSDPYLNYGAMIPPSRRLFHHLLLAAAKDGRVYDAGRLARFLYASMADFTFIMDGPYGIEKYLRYKADSLEAEGMVFEHSSYEDFNPLGFLGYYLFLQPLVKAYCYLFAALGVLRIAQEPPPLARAYKGKRYPLTPYDSLRAFQVTEFGKWCLGLAKQAPERPREDYQAVADKELLLVTMRGDSLERSVYLDRIGKKLGEDRWRVSPDSFIAGCLDKSHIQERIDRFKALIDPDPAPHWLSLFDKSLQRAGIFDRREEDVLVYRLTGDREVLEELLQDGAFRPLVRRAEGGYLLVPAKNQKKFFDALRTHGIAVFSA